MFEWYEEEDREELPRVLRRTKLIVFMCQEITAWAAKISFSV